MTTNDSSSTTTPASGASPSRPVLVLAASGKSGRRVARLLGEAGVPVRAASRSSAVRFDWAEPATWAPALAGVGAVYLVAPDDPAPVRDFVSEALSSGVRRFVLLSGRGIDHAVGSAFGEGMLVAEDAVRSSGAEWTVLRPNNFFQNFTEDLWHAPVVAGRLALPIGDVPEAFVDLDDVVEVAVRALTAGEGEHVNAVHEMSGPEGLTFAEAVAVVAEAAGRPVAYEELTPAAYREELRAAGVPEEAVSALDALFALHRAGHTAEPARGVEALLGRPANGLEEWAKAQAARGAWAR
ncbi:NAD(P)H-binding protein [Streptomyces sp. NPDC001941]|uniref:NAD(P)H-binding protein n=1 Tax=Streptomyces sp. NPDC001941 TaxID=3154659 RepID=UPI00331F6818